MPSNNCVCCPYPFVTIPGLLSFVTLILTWLAAINCAFFSIPIGDDDDNRDLYVGLWSVESDYAQDYDWYDHSDHICVSWYSMNYISSDDLDAPMKVARAFGLISGILATIAFVLILIPSCVVFDESSRNKYILSLSGMCIFIGIATLLELIALSSDICTSSSDCQLQSSGILAIVAGCLWFVIAGVFFFALKHPRTIRQQAEENVTVEQAPTEQPSGMEHKQVKTVTNADGSTTKTTTTTVVNADGTKTVTESAETIPAENA